MPEMVNTMLNLKRAGRGRKAFIVFVLALLGLMLLGWAVTKWRSVSRSPDRLDFMATVRPDDEFWLAKNVPGTHDWKRNLFPRDQAVALFRAMETAQPWEAGIVDRFFRYRRFPPQPPSEKAELFWCKGWEDRYEREGTSLYIHYNNELISYNCRIYVVPAEGREILDRMFPLEEEKVTATKSGGEKESGTNDTASGIKTLSDGK
jgi:hypothetical protein